MQFDKQDLDQLSKAPDWNRPGQYRVEEETCSKMSEKYEMQKKFKPNCSHCSKVESYKQ